MLTTSTAMYLMPTRHQSRNWIWIREKHTRSCDHRRVQPTRYWSASNARLQSLPVMPPLLRVKMVQMLSTTLLWWKRSQQWQPQLAQSAQRSRFNLNCLISTTTENTAARTHTTDEVRPRTCIRHHRSSPGKHKLSLSISMEQCSPPPAPSAKS